MSKKLTMTQRKFLRFTHIFCASLWGGGAVSMMLIVCFFQPTVAHDLTAYGDILFYIEFFVVGPGAGGCLLTGVVYAMYTPWGFFKHKWIIIKWGINIGYIVFGLVWFYPSLEALRSYGAGLPHDTPFLPGSFAINTYHYAQNIGTIALFTLAVALSVFKPWGRRSSKARDT